MNKQSLVFAATVLILGHAGLAFALGNPDNGPGCGLGKLAWSDYGGQKQIAPQVFMATTNGTFGSQTFGISSGTSGCTNDGVIMKNKHINLAEGAFESLKQDIARGEGEHLTSLALLLGVPESGRPAFFAMVQEHYRALVPDDDVTPLELVQAIQRAMTGHPELARVIIHD